MDRSLLITASMGQGGTLDHQQSKREGPKMEVTMVGIDLAKNVFRLHGCDANGKPVLRKQLARRQLLSFVANLPRCLVAMEACASARYWAREIEKLGHQVWLIAPRFVRPFVKANKNDALQERARTGGLSRTGSTPSRQRRAHGAVGDQQAWRSLSAHAAGSRCALGPPQDRAASRRARHLGRPAQASSWSQCGGGGTGEQECQGAVGAAQPRAELSTSAVSRPRPPSRWLRGRRAENGFTNPEIAQAVAES